MWHFVSSLKRLNTIQIPTAIYEVNIRWKLRLWFLLIWRKQQRLSRTGLNSKFQLEMEWQQSFSLSNWQNNNNNNNMKLWTSFCCDNPVFSFPLASQQMLSLTIYLVLVPLVFSRFLHLTSSFSLYIVCFPSLCSSLCYVPLSRPSSVFFRI